MTSLSNIFLHAKCCIFFKGVGEMGEVRIPKERTVIKMRTDKRSVEAKEGGRQALLYRVVPSNPIRGGPQHHTLAG